MRLISLLILLLAVMTLHAQSEKTTAKWIGVNNVFFKNKATNTTAPFPSDTSSSTLLKESLDKQFSIGFYFRKTNENKVYHQFDLFQLNWNENKKNATINYNPLSIHKYAGEDIKSFNLLLGYQIGKLFPIASKFTGDTGVGTFAWYEKANYVPFSSSSYPIKSQSIGIGFDIKLGINYQIHKNINIGYRFTLLSISSSWNTSYADNPTLTPDALKRSVQKNVNFKSHFFKSVLSFRNFNISYVF